MEYKMIEIQNTTDLGAGWDGNLLYVLVFNDKCQLYGHDEYYPHCRNRSRKVTTTKRRLYKFVCNFIG